MINYPLEFNSKTLATSGVQNIWKTTSNEYESAVSIPPEFKGPGGGFSPEDLYNQALANCFVATFKVYAENSKLTFEDVHVETRLVVDLDDSKKPVMKEFYLVAKIKSPNNADKAVMLAKKASQSGLILNSVKTICHFEFHVI